MARDAAGNPVAIQPEQVRWSSSRPQDVAVNAQGLITAREAFGYSQIQVELPDRQLSARLLISVNGTAGGSFSRPPVQATPTPPPSPSLHQQSLSGQVGDSLTISGQHLKGITGVSLAGIPLTFTLLSPQALQIVLPAGAQGNELLIETDSGPLRTTVTVTNRVWFVNQSAAGAANGLSWSNAFTDLQEALAVARAEDMIWLAKGIYTPHATDRNVSFNVPAEVALYGGFSGQETYLNQRDFSTNESILSGDLAGNDIYNTQPAQNITDNSLHVLRHGQNVLLDGLVIQGGHANQSGDLPSPRGAGIYSGSQLLQIKNSVIRDNHSVDRAGGWYTEATGTLQLENVTFLRNQANGTGGGALLNLSASLDFKNVKFIQSQANGSGGAGIRHESGAAISCSDCLFEQNQANGGGGAGLQLTHNTNPVSLSLSDTRFTQNQATGAGGSGIITTSGALNLTRVRFENNTHSLGALNMSGSLTGQDLTFSGNQASQPGGAINCNTCTTSLSNSVFNNNTSNSIGGAIRHGGNALTLTQVQFRDNQSNSPGGAIYSTGSNLTLQQVRFENNTANSNGGGLLQSSNGQHQLTQVSFTGNQANNGSGGGAHITGGGSLSLIKSTFSNNSSTATGGGLDFSGTTLSLQDNTFENNSAQQPGGGAYLNASGAVTGSSLRILSNSSQSVGGGLFFTLQDSLTLEHLYVIGNQSLNAGGGLYLTGTAGLNVSLNNAVFSQNSNTAADTTGGAISSHNINLSLNHASFGDNTATGDGDALSLHGSVLSLRNSIIWDAQDLPIHQNGNNLTAQYSVLRSLGDYTLQAASTGNSAQDPLFLDLNSPNGADGNLATADDGLSLQAASPALNLDSSGNILFALDILGRNRSGNPDAGAYERP